MDQALESRNLVGKLELESPESVSKVRTNLSELCSYTNHDFPSEIPQKEQEGENNFYRVRASRESAEGRVHLAPGTT